MSGVQLNQGWNNDVQYNGPLSIPPAAAFLNIMPWLVRVLHWTGSQWQYYDPNDPGAQDLLLIETGKYYNINILHSYFWDWPEHGLWLEPGWTEEVLYRGPNFICETVFWSLHGALKTAWAWVEGEWVFYDPNDIGSNLLECCPGQRFDLNLTKRAFWAWYQVDIALPSFDSYDGPDEAQAGENIEVTIGVRNSGEIPGTFIITHDPASVDFTINPDSSQECPAGGMVYWTISFTMPSQKVYIDVYLFNLSPECGKWIYLDYHGWHVDLSGIEPDIKDLEVGYAKVA